MIRTDYSNSQSSSQYKNQIEFEINWTDIYVTDCTELNDPRREPGEDRKANEDKPALARCSAASGASCPAPRRTTVGSSDEEAKGCVTEKVDTDKEGRQVIIYCGKSGGSSFFSLFGIFWGELLFIDF